MDGRFVCAALSSHYVILDVSKGGSQDLFPFEGTPAIARIAKVVFFLNFVEAIHTIMFLKQEEFLLSAPGGLGMFVTSAGVSERPPLQWGRGSESVSAFAYTAPYVVALADDGIAIYR